MRVDPSPASAVEVYWRPGCGFCSTLLRGLRRSGLPLRAVDIWRDPEAAALVRSLAGGNETVPTVVIGAHALVNPTVEEVLATVADQAPHLLPAGQPCPPPAWRWSGWWAPLSSVGLAALWAGLAIWHPTTTYHLGPLLAAAAWPRLERWRAGRRLRLRAVAVAAIGGAVVALGTLALLVALGSLRGPTLVGHGGAATESLVLLGLGSAYGAVGGQPAGAPRRGVGGRLTRAPIPSGRATSPSPTAPSEQLTAGVDPAHRPLEHLGRPTHAPPCWAGPRGIPSGRPGGPRDAGYRPDPTRFRRGRDCQRRDNSSPPRCLRL
jgi:glutaredoxin